MSVRTLPDLPKEGSHAWKTDCIRWRCRVLTGSGGHWCPDWDYLPIDETTPEWPYCTCEEMVA